MKEEDFLEWNEEMFKKYTNERLYFHPNPILRYTENKRVRLILNAIKGRESDNILEIGCGEAYVIRKNRKWEGGWIRYFRYCSKVCQRQIKRR